MNDVNMKSTFGVVDFVIFIGMLAFSMAVGVFYAIRDKKTASVENYFFGERKLSPIPVGLSIGVTFISSMTVLGYPVQSYLKGTIVLWFGVAAAVQVLPACLYYIPLCHRLQISSIYEYLERRFHRNIRKFASITFILKMIFMMSLIVYLAALALNAVTPLSILSSILLTGVVCTFYTTLGGVKAVIWVDTFQALIMLGGSVAVLIQTTILVGGVDQVAAAVKRGGRDTIWNFDPDPTQRDTFWTVVVGMGVTWCEVSCCSQHMTQRFLACKNVKDARIASIISGFPMALLMIVASLNGCAMFAYFEGCDPFINKEIDKRDELVSYLVVQIFRDVSGMAGLFVSAAFSGMLSTVSSGVNAISELVLEDFLIPVFPRWSEKKKLTASKVMAFLLGVSVATLAYLFSFMGKTVIQYAQVVGGLFGGPLLGLYTAGMFLPWTNTIGAFVGYIVGLLFSLWVAVGQLMYGPKPQSSGVLPSSIEHCSTTENVTSAAVTYSMEWNTTTSVPLFLSSTTSQTFTTSDERPLIADTLYSISYLYIGVMGLLMTVVVGLLMSIVTGANKPSESDPMLFLPFLDNSLLPTRVRKFFRFGVPELPDLKDVNTYDDEEMKCLSLQTSNADKHFHRCNDQMTYLQMNA